MKTLILWDIDGTLTLSGGAGMRALEAALKREFQRDNSLASIDFAGRTDIWIMRQIFAHVGLPDHAENIARLIAAYLNELPGALHNPGNRVLPGVAHALTAIAAHPGCVQALLTGNVERGARIKLGHHNLSHYFAWGAFADDAELRNHLGPVALRRAKEKHGVEFKPDRVFVIGDTPHDVACGKVIGAQTIAVATGQYSVGDLRAAGPTAVLPDLTDTAALLKLLGLA